MNDEETNDGFEDVDHVSDEIVKEEEEEHSSEVRNLENMEQEGRNYSCELCPKVFGKLLNPFHLVIRLMFCFFFQITKTFTADISGDLI